MTGFDAIGKVYTELKGAGLSVGDFIYQFSKPANIDPDEFIVLNTLPVPDTELQLTYVNCNIFVKDIYPGVPGNGRLKEITDEVLDVFPVSRPGEDIHVFLSDTSVFDDPDSDRFYVNIRLKVMMLNN